MKNTMRRELARQPFEEKIRKVSQLIQLSAAVKSSRVREGDESDSASKATGVRERNKMPNVIDASPTPDRSDGLARRPEDKATSRRPAVAVATAWQTSDESRQKLTG
jgi:hypothetical protein